MNDSPAAEVSDILIDIAQELGRTSELERLLPLVLERVTELLGAERALFALFDVDGQLDRVVVHNLPWEGPGHQLPVSQGLIEKVRDRGAVILVSDAATHEGFKERSSVQKLAVRFMLGLPIHIEDQVGGVICVDSRTASEPSPKDLRLLTALARLVGTAVENALMFEEQAFRTTLLDQLIHEFRTPLSVITVNAGLLSQVSDPDSEEAHEMAFDIAASAQRMAQMVENTLELVRIEAGETTPIPGTFDVIDELPRHLQSLEVVAQPLDLKLEVAIPVGLPPVKTVPDWVWIILDTLLFNSLKHAFRGTTIRIGATRRDDRGPKEAQNRAKCHSPNVFRRMKALAARPGAPFIEVTIENQGPPIPAELVPALFNPIARRSTSSGKLRRTNLGLALVDQCVRHLGGAVWLNATDQGVIRFSFTLPTDLSSEAPPRRQRPL